MKVKKAVSGGGPCLRSCFHDAHPALRRFVSHPAHLTDTPAQAELYYGATLPDGT